MTVKLRKLEKWTRRDWGKGGKSPLLLRSIEKKEVARSLLCNSTVFRVKDWLETVRFRLLRWVTVLIRYYGGNEASDSGFKTYLYFFLLLPLSLKYVSLHVILRECPCHFKRWKWVLTWEWGSIMMTWKIYKQTNKPVLLYCRCHPHLLGLL